MKKFVPLCIAIIMTFVLFACGQTTTQSPRDYVAETIAAMDKIATLVQLGFEETVTALEETSIKAIETESFFGQHSLNQESTVQEALVYDSENIKVTVKSLDFNAQAGPQLVLLLENANNRSVNLKLMDIVVNGFMMGDSSSFSIPAGGNELATVSVNHLALAAAGIETIQYYEFSLRIDESQDWSHSVTTERLRVETTAVQSDALAQDQQTTLLVEREGVRISLKKFDTQDSESKLILYLLVENNTDIDIAVEAQELAINGVSFRPVYRKTLLAGSKSMDMVYLLAGEESLENGHQAETLEIAFEVTNRENQNRVFKTGMLKINIE
jgi:archaellum component FlaF (FlaF/FlaG flagellin family)